MRSTALSLFIGLAAVLSGCEAPDFSGDAAVLEVSSDARSIARSIAIDRPVGLDLSSDGPLDASQADGGVSEPGQDRPLLRVDSTVQPVHDAGVPELSLVGQWVSEGEDLAPLLAGPGVNLVRLDADFRADLTYTVHIVDVDDLTQDFSGRYTTASAGAGLSTIVLEQDRPRPVTSVGIFKLEAAGGTWVLVYEVAQVAPPLNGVSPPTAALGFGSTSDGSFGRDNVQTYRRVSP